MIRRAAERVAAVLQRVEDALIALFTALLVLLAGGQIVARTAFDSGWVDLDAFLRTMVLWIALLGAMAAARDDKHLAVDAVARFVHGGIARALRAVAYLGAALVCAALAWYAFELVRGEYQSATIAFAGVPAWVTQAIMPVAFAVIALRFATHAFRPPRSTEPAGVPEHP